AALQAAGSVGALAGLVLLGVGGGVGFWLGQEVEHERARSAAALEAPPLVPGVVDAPVPATPPVALEPITSPPSPAASDERTKSAPPRARAHRRPAASSIDDELALLRRVERALRNNDPALARALLGELDERFPDSRLGEERAAARRIADCRSGEPDAVARARDFVREHGASVYRQRIVLACALDKNPE
ncbi:MAG TPA: hypothetical protein VMG12_38385, partial [Polyangiaceae bacterium]|nr:hypothetical protein [Polyangiaceae bacterium]